MDRYFENILKLLSLGPHPVSIRDIGTLTFSSEDDVIMALSQLRGFGYDIVTDGESAEIRG